MICGGRNLVVPSFLCLAAAIFTPNPSCGREDTMTMLRPRSSDTYDWAKVGAATCYGGGGWGRCTGWISSKKSERDMLDGYFTFRLLFTSSKFQDFGVCFVFISLISFLDCFHCFLEFWRFGCSACWSCKDGAASFSTPASCACTGNCLGGFCRLIGIECTLIKLCQRGEKSWSQRTNKFYKLRSCFLKIVAERGGKFSSTTSAYIIVVKFVGESM